MTKSSSSSITAAAPTLSSTVAAVAVAPAAAQTTVRLNNNAHPSPEQALRLKSRATFTPSLASGKNAKFIAITRDLVPCHADLFRNGKPVALRFTIIRPLCGGFSSVPYTKGPQQERGAKKLTELQFVPFVPPFAVSSSMTTTSVGAAHMSSGGGEHSGDSLEAPVPFVPRVGTIPDNHMQPVMQMWSYEPAEKNENKGPRCEDVTWTLGAGNTVLTWMDTQRLARTAVDRAMGRVNENYEPIVPENIMSIPAMTLCEISVIGKSRKGAEKGYSLNVTNIKPLDYSLYSCLPDLVFLPRELEVARLAQMEFVARYPCLTKDIEIKDVPFWAPVGHQAVLDDSSVDLTQTVRLVNWNEGGRGAQEIDLPIDVLLRYTNTTRVDHACAMLEMAIASGALSVLVFNSEFWQRKNETGFRAIPIVHIETLLAALTPTSFEAAPYDPEMRNIKVFQTGVRAEIDGEPYTVRILFGTSADSVATGPPPPLSDFALCGLESEVASAFPVQFDLVHRRTGAVVPKVFKGYFNATPANLVLLRTGQKRRRFQTMEE